MSMPVEAPSEVAEQEPGLFTTRLAYWQRVLQQGGAQAASTFGAEMINELDSLCPDAGEECTFNGYGLVPLLDSEETPKPVVWGTITGNRGLHNGMQLKSDKDGNPILTYDIILSSAGQWVSECEYRGGSFHAYLDPDKSSIVSPHRFDKELTNPVGKDISFGPGLAVLRQASDIFAGTILERRFLRLPHDRQIEFVDGYLSHYDAYLQALHVPMGIKGLYHYPVPPGKPDALGEHIQPFNDEFVYGNCSGLGFLGRAALMETPLRRMSDIPDKLAGICLVLAAIRTQPEQGLVQNDITYIPVSSQDLLIQPIDA